MGYVGNEWKFIGGIPVSEERYSTAWSMYNKRWEVKSIDGFENYILCKDLKENVKFYIERGENIETPFEYIYYDALGVYSVHDMSESEFRVNFKDLTPTQKRYINILLDSDNNTVYIEPLENEDVDEVVQSFVQLAKENGKDASSWIDSYDDEVVIYFDIMLMLEFPLDFEDKYFEKCREKRKLEGWLGKYKEYKTEEQLEKLREQLGDLEYELIQLKKEFNEGIDNNG